MFRRRTTPRCRAVPPIWILVLLSLAPARGAEPKYRRITMTDGRVLIGQAADGEGALVVKTDQTHIYVSRARVARNEEAVGYEPPPAYTFNDKLAATPKKGKIGGVVQNVRWGSMDPVGTLPITLTDPKLGEVSYTLVVRKITPVLVRLEGVEYEHTWSFPHATFGALPRQLVMSRIDRKDPASLMKGVRFFLLAGSFSTARELLSAYQAAGGDAKAAAARQVELEAEELRGTLQAAADLVTSHRHPRAVPYVNRLACSDELRAAEPDLAARADKTAAAIAADIATLYRARQLLARRSLADAGLTLGQARRMLAVLDKLPDRGKDVPDRLLPSLARPWATALAGAKLAEGTLAAAAELAGKTAAFFAGAGPSSADLGQDYQDSRLPMPLKLALFRFARDLPKIDKPPAWQAVEYRHHETDKTYHYYIQLPSNYHRRRPTPVLIALHGQLSRAEDVRGVWGRQADKRGMILISPEYIYGRKWGYKYSAQEHQAVLGALWDAAGRYNIDTDRVYLQGTSQGGHACWDIGAAHAGRFAGIVPVIGAPVAKASYPNFHDTAACAVDGSLDAGAPQYNRAWARAAMRTGCDATYVEYQGRGHEGFSEEYDRLGRWMLARQRPAAPERIALVAFRPCDARRRWARIVRANPPLPAVLEYDRSPCATVTGLCRNNVFSLTTKNVAELELLLLPELVDWAKPVTVTVNGARKLRRPVRPDWRGALDSSLRRRDRQEIHLASLTVSL